MIILLFFLASNSKSCYSTTWGIQIVQQIVGPNGEIQQIPIQLTSQQLQMIRTQMTGMNFQKIIYY